MLFADKGVWNNCRRFSRIDILSGISFNFRLYFFVSSPIGYSSTTNSVVVNFELLGYSPSQIEQFKAYNNEAPDRNHCELNAPFSMPFQCVIRRLDPANLYHIKKNICLYSSSSCVSGGEERMWTLPTGMLINKVSTKCIFHFFDLKPVFLQSL